MKKWLEVSLLAVVCSAAFFPKTLFAQACKDDEAMVESYRKDLSDLVSTIQKESQEQFNREYHRKTSLSKLTLCTMLVQELVSCLDKAENDPAAAKADVDSSKAKHEAYAKFLSKVTEDKKQLKEETEPEKAKALIGKFDLKM